MCPFLAQAVRFELTCPLRHTDFESAPLWPLRYACVFNCDLLQFNTQQREAARKIYFANPLRMSNGSRCLRLGFPNTKKEFWGFADCKGSRGVAHCQRQCIPINICSLFFISCQKNTTLLVFFLLLWLSTRGFSLTFVLRSNANGVRTRTESRCQLASIRLGEVHFACKMYPVWYLQFKFHL